MDKNRKSVGEVGEVKWIPDGFHFLGPEESKARRKLMDSIHCFFSENGYSEVVPPSFDFSSSFSGHLTDKEKSHLLKYRDISGSEISPSFDLTIQVVKGMAGFSHLKENQKVFYSGRTVKDYHRRNGAKREVFQVGAEIIGKSDAVTFAGLLEELEELFISLKFQHPITLVLGNTLVFANIGEYLNFTEKEKEKCSYLIYSKNTTSLIEFFQEKNIPSDFQNLINSILFNFDIAKLQKEILPISGKYTLGLEEIFAEIDSILSVWNSKKRLFDFCLDFSLVRDLNYYTGFVFHAYAGSASDPLFMGGAYDHLYERYSGIQKKACGFAMNIDIIESLLQNQRIGV